MRQQEDSTSCGMQQCHAMGELDTNIPSWAQTFISKQEIEFYWLAIARRLINFDGCHHEE